MKMHHLPPSVKITTQFAGSACKTLKREIVTSVTASRSSFWDMENEVKFILQMASFLWLRLMSCYRHAGNAGHVLSNSAIVTYKLRVALQ